MRNFGFGIKGPRVAQTDLNLPVWPRMIPSSWSASLHPPYAEVPGVHHTDCPSLCVTYSKALGFICRWLVYFELTCVWNAREVFGLILLHADCQFPELHLLKRPSMRVLRTKGGEHT